MFDLLRTFAAFSMAGAAMLSLLPQGSTRRTAAMAVGLLTLLVWLEGVLGLFDWRIETELPASVLVPVHAEDAE